MADRIEKFGKDFWTVRGSFKIGRVVDIGTQAALIRRPSGRFVLLDSYTLKGAVRNEIMALTQNGDLLDAVLNLHPFHTVHCEEMHQTFPGARQIGSDRHVLRFPDLSWDEARIDDPAVWDEFSDCLEFSIPRGVDFISRNESVHFSSVLAYHPGSQTLHSDDTLMSFGPRRQLPVIGAPQRLAFHPTLGQALEKRADAADDFTQWAEEIAGRWRDAERVCAAHISIFETGRRGMDEHILAALARVQNTLTKHRKKYG